MQENIEEYQCGFQKGERSTINQLSIIDQLIEKKYKYRQNISQLFIDFKKAYLIVIVLVYNIVNILGKSL